MEKLGEIAEWLAYDIPRDIVGQAWGGKYRGQKQKWYALRFTGEDAEIDIAHPAGGHEPEFIDWRWVGMQRIARTWWCRSNGKPMSGWSRNSANMRNR